MKKRNILILVFALGALLATLITFSINSNFSDTVKVSRGVHKFIIPKKYASRDGFLPDSFSSLLGLDSGSRDYLLSFSAQELSEIIPEYQINDGGYDEEIRAILSVLTDEEIERYQNPFFGYRGEIWNGTGSFSNKKIEPWGDTGLYKIYRSVEYPKVWNLLKLDPRENKQAPTDTFDFWIAQCRKTKSPVTESGVHIGCQSYVYFDDIVIDFGISEQNIYLIDEVRAYLKTKVGEWVDK